MTRVEKLKEIFISNYSFVVSDGNFESAIGWNVKNNFDQNNTFLNCLKIDNKRVIYLDSNLSECKELQTLVQKEFEVETIINTDLYFGYFVGCVFTLTLVGLVVSFRNLRKKLVK